MAKTYLIREFDSIVDENCRKEQHPGFHPVDSYTFHALEAFVLENKSDKSNPLELLSLGAKREWGKTITARNYIGVITFNNGTTLQILPKLAPVNSTDYEAKERYVLIKMLQAVMNLPLKKFDQARLDTASMNIFELFIQSFVASVSNLAKRGLKSSYEPIENNELFLKGKIDFPQNIKKNHSHKERFVVQYDTFSVNRAENRLIKSTLNLLKGKTQSANTRRKIDNVLILFKDVAVSANIEKDFSSCAIDRTMGNYTSILDWCKVFLRGESFTSFKGSEVATSLLFPMETLFEAYVAKILKSVAVEYGWKLSTQDRGKYLFDSHRKFALRPDIVLRKKQAADIILDTKWKRITSDLKNISQADLYQMYAYWHRYQASDVILIYPKTKEHSGLIEKSFHSEKDATVHVFFFDLIDPKASARELFNCLGTFNQNNN